MARPGTRRYAVDLLYNMRLYDPSIRSIREGEQRLPQDIVTALKSYTAMTKEQKEQFSRGKYGEITKQYTRMIRGVKDKERREEITKARVMMQIHSVQGKHALTAKQYKWLNNFLGKVIELTPEEIENLWGIVSP